MKKYRIRKGSAIDCAIRAAKPLGVLVVAGLFLAAYSWAAADEIQTRQAQADEYEQVKEAYIAAEELASYEQVSESLEIAESKPIETSESEPEQVKDAENDILDAEINEETAETDAKWTSLGTFKVTAYCPCEACCGAWANGITASGMTAAEGVTVAADTSVLPFDTIIQIDGEEYEVQDRGGAIQGNRIDIYFDDHETAEAYGVQYHEVLAKEAA